MEGRKKNATGDVSEVRIGTEGGVEKIWSETEEVRKDRWDSGEGSLKVWIFFLDYQI